jgi:energy-coupling factor transporter transmembrane protein EcfT
MEWLTIKVALVIGALLLIGFLLVVWKFFGKVFKHVVIMLLIGVAGAVFFIYMVYARYGSFSARPQPNKGKHAYMKASGEYIGVVEAEGEDSRRGKVWIIRPAGGYPQKYSKSRVELKDKMELKPAPTPAPTPESKPVSDKVDKKKKN